MNKELRNAFLEGAIEYCQNETGSHFDREYYEAMALLRYPDEPDVLREAVGIEVKGIVERFVNHTRSTEEEYEDLHATSERIAALAPRAAGGGDDSEEKGAAFNLRNGKSAPAAPKRVET